MESIKRYQVRGIPGYVERVTFDGRIVDFWAPSEKTAHLLIAHDGQNVFDWRTSTRRSTWKMAQTAIAVSKENGISPPVIIAVFHSKSPENPWGRVFDLAPQDPFQNGIRPGVGSVANLSAKDLNGNKYLEDITETIVPRILKELDLSQEILDKAVIGSSMGGLASLYALSKRPDFFGTALSLSPHWTAGDNPLVDALIDLLPPPHGHKIWMSHGTRGHDKKYGPFQDRANQKMTPLGLL